MTVPLYEVAVIDREKPDNTGTGSNYKGMIIYDLAVLFSTALPALAHDSLLFKNLGKDVEDGIIRIYTNTDKQIFIAYDKQGDCRPATQKKHWKIIVY